MLLLFVVACFFGLWFFVVRSLFLVLCVSVFISVFSWRCTLSFFSLRVVCCLLFVLCWVVG